jgi:hypothetical protein
MVCLGWRRGLGELWLRCRCFRGCEEDEWEVVEEGKEVRKVLIEFSWVKEKVRN